MDDVKEQIAAACRERDAVLVSGDLDKLLAMVRRSRPDFVPMGRDVLEVMLHKARTAVVSLPAELRGASKAWLLERGYESWDDGNV
jgi:hypothetical protein